MENKNQQIKAEVNPRNNFTKGEYRVGINFNPSENPDVTTMKRMGANFIDQLELISTLTTNPEVKRLCALAQTEIEEATMNAVKAVTKPALPTFSTYTPAV